jgi:alkylation response protein AidB-like acyl-CoA dehydrogenase
MVFGKPLSSQAVIRSKLAAMISRVEAGQNWLEHITYQMNNVRSHLARVCLSLLTGLLDELRRNVE